MKKIYCAFLLAGVVGLGSCLKEDPALNPAESNSVIEIYNPIPTPTASPADAIHPLYNQAFEIQPSVEWDLEVSYSGADAAPQDITVTVGLDEQAMHDYNDEQGTHLEFIDPSLFDVDTWTVTIPAGQKRATLHFTFKTAQFDPSTTYGFPVKIMSVSSGQISSNFGTVIFAMGAKNKYDGVYNLRSKQVDWTVYGIGVGPFNWPDETIYMITTSGNSVNMYSDLHGSYIHVAITTANGLTGFGQTNPRFVFDPGTDMMTDAYNDMTTTNGRTFNMNPAVTDNRWDPATGDIYAAIVLKQPGRPDLMIYDTLRYVGPRP